MAPASSRTFQCFDLVLSNSQELRIGCSESNTAHAFVKLRGMCIFDCAYRRIAMFLKGQRFGSNLRENAGGPHFWNHVLVVSFRHENCLRPFPTTQSCDRFPGQASRAHSHIDCYCYCHSPRTVKKNSRWPLYCRSNITNNAASLDWMCQNLELAGYSQLSAGSSTARHYATKLERRSLH